MCLFVCVIEVADAVSVSSLIVVISSVSMLYCVAILRCYSVTQQECCSVILLQLHYCSDQVLSSRRVASFKCNSAAEVQCCGVIVLLRSDSVTWLCCCAVIV